MLADPREPRGSRPTKAASPRETDLLLEDEGFEPSEQAKRGPRSLTVTCENAAVVARASRSNMTKIIPRAEAVLRWRWRNPMGFVPEIRFAEDSPLEERRFEPSVPLRLRGDGRARRWQVRRSYSVRIVGNSVGAAALGAILNCRINRRIPEAGDAVRPRVHSFAIVPATLRT
jgi:hypothetical protein